MSEKKKRYDRKISLEKAIKRVKGYIYRWYREYKGNVVLIKVCDKVYTKDIDNQYVTKTFQTYIKSLRYFLRYNYVKYLLFLDEIDKRFKSFIDVLKMRVRVVRSKDFKKDLIGLIRYYYLGGFETYKKTIKKCSMRYDLRFKYFAVSEYHSNRRHYNILIFNLPNIDERILSELCGKKLIKRYFFNYLKGDRDLVDSLTKLVRMDTPVKVKKIRDEKELKEVVDKYIINTIKANYRFKRGNKYYYKSRMKG